MTTRIILYFFLMLGLNVCFTLAVLAQKGATAPIETYHYGTKTNNQLERAIESIDGGIIAVGPSESMYSWGGMDVMLMKVDRGGQLVYKKSFGKKLDDYPKALAENGIGQILIGGVTKKSQKHKAAKLSFVESAWLSCKDYEGQHVWETILAENAENTSIEAIFIAPNHQNIAVIGIKEHKIWMILLDAKGKVLREKVLDIESHLMKVESLKLLVVEETFYLYGTGNWAREGNRKSPFIVKTNEFGEVLKFVDFPDYIIEKTGNIIQLPSGRLAMIGTILNQESEEDVFYLKIKSDLDKRQVIFEDYSGRNFDEGIDLTYFDERVYLAGSTRAHKSDAHQENVLLLNVDENGADLKPLIWGDGKEERGRQLIFKKDGSLWLCGLKDVGNFIHVDTDFYFVRLKKSKKSNSLSPQQRAIIKIKGKSNIHNKALKLSVAAQQSIDFQIENNNAVAAEGLYLETSYRNNKGIEGLSMMKKLPITRIEAGQAQSLKIPISTETKVRGGRTTAIIEIKDVEQNLIDQLKIPIELTEAPYATFKVLEQQFKNQEQGGIYQNQAAQLLVTIQNTSQQAAKNVLINFSQPEGLVYKSAYNFEIPLLEKGETYQCQLDFIAPTSASKLSLKAIVQEQESPHTFDFDFSSPLLAAPVAAAEVTPSAKAAAFPLIATWNPAPPNRSIQKKYKISVKGIANRALALEDFWLLHNGERSSFVGRKSDFDEVKLSSVAKAQKVITTFSTTVDLKPQEVNYIAVEIKNDLGTDVTKTVAVTYEGADMGTLHVMSIGVKDDNGQLKYTTKDATDFAALFDNQAGKLFGQVKTYLYTKPDSTTVPKITSQINYFNRQQRLHNLSPNDAIVLFISSHGFMGEDEAFRIKCSGYDANNQKHTSLNFREDIIDSLSRLDCQKFLFVDACHSGSINESFQGRKAAEFSYSEAVQKIVQAQKNIWTVTSCGPGQYSYEDDAWQNGAFTQVLTGILSNPQLCAQLDQPNAKGDKDRSLSLAEIYMHLKNEVQKKVKKVRKKAQTPYMPGELREVDVPFFAY